MSMQPPRARLRDAAAQHVLDADICVHILSVSATMVGVCLTAIGLIRVVITLRRMETLVDDLVGIDAVLFVAAGLLAYWAMRTRTRGRLHHIELIAERVFLAAMVLMGIACLALVYGIKSL
jgi:amino acid transporter